MDHEKPQDYVEDEEKAEAIAHSADFYYTMAKENRAGKDTPLSAEEAEIRAKGVEERVARFYEARERAKKMEPDELVNEVREALVKELEKALVFYGPSWGRKAGYTHAIERLRENQTIAIGDPFITDALSNAFDTVGLGQPNETDPQLRAKRQAIYNMINGPEPMNW